MTEECCLPTVRRLLLPRHERNRAQRELLRSLMLRQRPAHHHCVLSLSLSALSRSILLLVHPHDTHPQCTHPNDDIKTDLTEDQMMANIFKYIDKLFKIVRPTKLVYMAIDGTAPRAKMNQQRQRRFRSATEAAQMRMEAIARGEKVPDNPFDSNCITPGTPFMQKLSQFIQYFVRKKIKEDESWRGIKVIFSGAEVPGEGEHKIMEYIRNMKMQADYEPNLRHCLYGLDADLIMLGLASHEPHFALLREEVVFSSNRSATMNRKALSNLDEFQFLHISLLREYLDLEFSNGAPKW